MPGRRRRPTKTPPRTRLTRAEFQQQFATEPDLEVDDAIEWDDHAPPWLRAKHAMLAAAARAATDHGAFEIGHVDSWGRGLSRQAFATDISLDPDPDQRSGPHVALLTHHETDLEYPERVRREARVLEWTWPRIHGLRVPRPLALLDHPHAPILVVSFVPGIEVDLRMGRMHGVLPWQLVADAATAIHRVEPPPADVLPPRDRRHHRIELLDDLLRSEPTTPELRDALAWMRTQLDRLGKGALLHGDLLGQNLRLYPGDSLGVIDWEHCDFGDPAHDLAIVTRGVRRPFQCPDGRARLLDAYNKDSPLTVSAEDLRFFELALLILLHRNDTVHAAEYHGRLAALVRTA